MRSIFVDLSADEAVSRYCFAGYEGEHNATELVVALPGRMTNLSQAEYRFLFETAKGEVIFSAAIPLSEEGTLSVFLPCSLMHPPILKAYIGCYLKSGGELELVAKSSEILLGVQKSIAEDGGELDVNAGVVPGLVIEEEVREHSENPPSGKAVFRALETKVDKTQITERMNCSAPARNRLPSEKAVAEALESKVDRSDLKGSVSPLEQATDLHVPTEKAVAEALESKVDRSDLKGSVSPLEQATDLHVPTEKAVAEALLPLMKKEEYVVDSQIAFDSTNPVENRVIAENFAPNLKKKKMGRMIAIDDASEIGQIPKLVAKTNEGKTYVPRTLLQIEVNAMECNMSAGEGCYQVKEIVWDDPDYGYFPVYRFDNGMFWVDSGERIEGAPEDFSDVKVGDWLYYGYDPTYQDNALYTTKEQGGEEIAAAGKSVSWYRKNLFDIGSLTDYGNKSGYIKTIDRELQEIVSMVRPSSENFFIQLENRLPAGIYTISAKQNNLSSPRMIIRLFDKEGKAMDSSKVSLNGMHYNLHYEAWYYDGGRATVTIPDEVSCWCLGFSPMGTVGNDVRISQIQVEIGTEMTAYEKCEKGEEVTDHEGKIPSLSFSDSMVTLVTEAGTWLEVEYNASLNKTMEKLEKAIRDLGGEIGW